MTPIGRVRLQRGIIILPSAFTIANLFFGMYAMIAADRGDFVVAAWYIVFAALLDMVDGRIARFTSTGSRFGAELDSLVDAISFGMAPAFLVYKLHFADASWGWTLSFLYVVAVVVRLARFNVEQAGEAKRHFHGLPSPTAGMILATAHPFTQTEFFALYLSGLPWSQVMGSLMVVLSALMLSHVPYPVVPRIGFDSARGITVSAILLGLLATSLAIPSYFFFTALSSYTLYGAGRAFLLGLRERPPEDDPLFDDGEEGGGPDRSGQELRRLDYGNIAPVRHRSPHPPSRPAEREAPALDAEDDPSPDAPFSSSSETPS